MGTTTLPFESNLNLEFSKFRKEPAKIPNVFLISEGIVILFFESMLTLKEIKVSLSESFIQFSFSQEMN